MLKSLNDSEDTRDDVAAGADGLSGFGSRWAGLSLARQFVLAASVVVLIAMGTIGAWVNQKIEQGVTQNTAAAAALYMDALIAPLAQDLALDDKISKESADKLDVLLKSEEIRGSVAAVKIWYRKGRIAYSTWDGLVGRTFNPTPALRAAWKGTVTAEFEGLRHEDDYRERALNTRLLEVYAPIRERSSNRIIAVSEFYIRANSLQSELTNATLQSWLVVGSAALLMMFRFQGLSAVAAERSCVRKILSKRKSNSLRNCLRAIVNCAGVCKWPMRVRACSTSAFCAASAPICMTVPRNCSVSRSCGSTN